MGKEMNVPDNKQLLITNLVELEEQAVLQLVEERLASGADPYELIEAAQEAMRVVGERYEQRQYYISGMMMAAEIFREVLERVEPVLVRQLSGHESGHILLGTVQGDIHDIGKNIFSILLRCNGFTVTDLGVDVPPEQFVAEAQRLQPDILALSGLLTISYETMKATVEQLRASAEEGLRGIPVIIGGGMINAMVCGFVGAEYWAADAMFGVQLCKQIMAERGE